MKLHKFVILVIEFLPLLSICKYEKGKNFLYCSGQNVVIRDIENPAIADIYTEHAKQEIFEFLPEQNLSINMIHLVSEHFNIG